MSEPIKILRVVTEEIGIPRNDGTSGSALYRVPLELSAVPPPGWVSAFVDAWDHPQSWTSMHQPGIASVSGKRIILERTTVERVGGDHKATLESAVLQANETVAVEQKKEVARMQQLLQENERHRSHVAAEAAKIKF